MISALYSDISVRMLSICGCKKSKPPFGSGFFVFQYFHWFVNRASKAPPFHTFTNFLYKKTRQNDEFLHIQSNYAAR